jgi:hypothetical protein
METVTRAVTVLTHCTEAGSSARGLQAQSLEFEDSVESGMTAVTGAEWRQCLAGHRRPRRDAGCQVRGPALALPGFEFGKEHI